VPPRASRRGRPRLVTLTSDVGWAYAAQMRAVLLHALPPSHVVELTHDLPAHAIAEAAWVLRSVAERFPAGTVHLVVVDPGVGGHRAPVAVRCGDGSLLVGPDNGVLAPLARALGHPRAYRIEPERVGVGPRVGTTFDGRDLFAPAAARLALGTPPDRLGPVHPLRDLVLPTARRRGTDMTGEVVHVDRFGNLLTNIPTDWVVPAPREVTVRLGSGAPRRVPWSSSYEAIGRGRLGALGSSFGTVEVAVAQGRADRRCRARAGTPVHLSRRAPADARATETVNSGRILRARGRPPS
jgi:S-adenosyl-L-methionine hydrolase (adenosine-forming)